MNASTSIETLRYEPAPARTQVRRTDRLWDAAALVLVSFGVTLFFLARRALTSLGAGTYRLPDGTTYVARTDLHVAQTRMAIWFIVVGVAIGVVAAARHRWLHNE